MRKPTIKSVMKQVETLAKAEYRDIVGQLKAMVDLWYQVKLDTPSKPKASVPATKQNDTPIAMPNTGKKQRKPRSDIGKPRKAKPVLIQPELPLRKPRAPLTAQQKRNISMGRKLALARAKLEKIQAHR